jgi:L-lactate dehydrogenase complex protein LldF
MTQSQHHSSGNGHNTAINFQPQVKVALADSQLRGNFDRAMTGLMHKRTSAFADWDLESLRDLGQAIRQQSLQQLPDLLEQLESQCQTNGIQVHWARDGDEACRVITEICQQRQAKSVIKGKSMVTEEMELNAYLEQRGYTVLESDLGEYIVQMAKETPSHIIMPAIHKNTAEIAELMHTMTGVEKREDAYYLTDQARQQLREKFMQADVGISGVNFAVAETGTLCLVENEGNGRLTTTTPPCHIAVTGIEKVVPKLTDVAPLLSLLTRSATGQAITTYVNMISRPRQADEKDGPEAVHLVLVDNGRSDIYQDEELAQTLQCIRCGACMNHCPVYTRIGGHAYGTTYPGPIGQVLMPQLMGLEQTPDFASASSLCGSCGEVCPVKIPLPSLLLRLRREAVDGDKTRPSTVPGHGSKRAPLESLIWMVWRGIHRHPFVYRHGTRLASHLRALSPKRLGGWTRYRTPPKLAKTTLHSAMSTRSRRQQS